MPKVIRVGNCLALDLIIAIPELELYLFILPGTVHICSHGIVFTVKLDIDYGASFLSASPTDADLLHLYSLLKA